MKERIGSRDFKGRDERRTGLEKNEGKDRRQGSAGEGEKAELV